MTRPCALKFLVINTDYPEFLHSFYRDHPGLEVQSYETQLRARYESLFGVADFYSSNLRRLGHEAYDIYTNNECLQYAWMREEGIASIPSKSQLSLFQRMLAAGKRVASRRPLACLEPVLRPLLNAGEQKASSWYYAILAHQIKHYKPDVILNQDMGGISATFFAEMRPYYRFLIGQHAATQLRMDASFKCYDLMISSFPPTVDYFRQQGCSAVLNRLGFESRVLARLGPAQKKYDVALVGSFYDVHSSRVAFLNDLYAQLDRPETIKVWAPSIDHLPIESPIRGHYMGPAWGTQMYEILNASKMTLNHHGDVPPYANNMRLYEATGVGTLLLTDWKINLSEIFTPGREVVAYRTVDECADLIQHYLRNVEERELVSRAGQERTLRQHTFLHRMQELVDVVHKYL